MKATFTVQATVEHVEGALAGIYGIGIWTGGRLVITRADTGDRYELRVGKIADKITTVTVDADDAQALELARKALHSMGRYRGLKFTEEPPRGLVW